jgi:hypothetical protein
LKYVEQAVIESEDGRTLLAKIRLDYQGLLADRPFEALGASTKDELRNDPSIKKYFQDQVDSLPERQTLKNVDLRVEIVDSIPETATRKSLSSQGKALALLEQAWPSFAIE